MPMCGAAKGFAAPQRKEGLRLWPGRRDQARAGTVSATRDEKGRPLAEPPQVVSTMSAASYFPAAARASISSGTAVL